MPQAAIYDDIPLGVCILKRDRVELPILYANQAMANMLGEDIPDDLIGLDFQLAWPEAGAADFARKLRSPNPPRHATLSVGATSKSFKRWILLSVQEKDFDDIETYTLWATDISASKQIEEQLHLAVEQADATAEQKSNFLATMSHEIRTPMQSVYGLLELIEQQEPAPDILSMAATAKQSASGLLEILNDILDFAKMDADQMELDHFEVPVRTLARGINEAMAVKVQGKDIQLLDNIDEDVPFVIVGDPKRLRQVIVNLMGNALKFTQEGSVIIHINRDLQALSPPAKGLGLRFEIADTGMGMTKEVCERLFTPFVQADNSTSRKFGGTGLGLSICKKLVEMMGGEIGVYSTPGQGSTFWFEIPTEEVGIDTNVLEMPKLDGISVLSVEDHPQGAKEIVKSLQSMGATIESCPTYAEGLELAKRRPFDVGIIDQGLPDGEGLDLIRNIMELRPFMGLIMYTVRDDAGMQQTLQSLGVTYLAKPASRIGLGEAVKDAANKTVKMTIDGPTKLVIAEDTESVRDVLRRQLDTLGVEATFVTNGKEALSAVRSGEYGILFTDLHMPELDGYGLTAAIRDDDKKQDRHFPVIALTADIQMSQRQTYMSHGFDECLLKPVSLGQFRRLLVRWGLLEEDTKIEETAKPLNNSASQSPEAETPAIDKDAIVQQMGALDESTIEMLGMFVDMTAPLIEKTKTAGANQNIHDLKEVAHSLKGAARSACANVLGDLASKLQDKSEKGEFDSNLIEDIETEFERVRNEINTL